MTDTRRRHPLQADLIVPSHDPNDLRIGELIKPLGVEDAITRGAGVLIGFPSDAGVRLNHGRLGAHRGPQELRRALYRMLANSAEGDLSALVLHDLGNVECLGNPLEADQEQLGIAVAEVLAAGAMPIVMGGGHETSYGHFLGCVATGQQVAIINVDAHHDVRKAEQSTSGTSFRQALAHGSCCQYNIVGVQPHAVSKPYRAYLEQAGCELIWRSDVRLLGAEHAADALLARVPSGARIMLTVDLDVVDAAFAPGVSATCVDGLLPGEMLTIVRKVAADPRCASFDVVELNPEFDIDGHTARLAALAIRCVMEQAAARAS